MRAKLRRARLDNGGTASVGGKALCWLRRHEGASRQRNTAHSQLWRLCCAQPLRTKSPHSHAPALRPSRARTQSHQAEGVDRLHAPRFRSVVQAGPWRACLRPRQTRYHCASNALAPEPCRRWLTCVAAWLARLLAAPRARSCAPQAAGCKCGRALLRCAARVPKTAHRCLRRFRILRRVESLGASGGCPLEDNASF